jgi:hypothetical protein
MILFVLILTTSALLSLAHHQCESYSDSSDSARDGNCDQCLVEGCVGCDARPRFYCRAPGANCPFLVGQINKCERIPPPAAAGQSCNRVRSLIVFENSSNCIACY